MSEERTGGRKEFLFSVMWSVLLLFVGKCIIYIIPSYKVVGGILTVLMFCVLGFFVMTRYAAIFTYTLKGYNLRINRMIGKRNKEIEIKISDIESISRKRPENMPKAQNVYKMCASVFSKRRLYYVSYVRNNTKEVLIFEPSEEMVKRIMSLRGEEGRKQA